MFPRANLCLTVAVLLSAFTAATPAHARIGLVVGEPFGSFGTMMPVGHASIYLDHLCVDTPTRLRACRPGELGAVISRYHDLRSTRTDWLATPASVFFYGVDDPAQTPTFITPPLEAELRESYRQAHLLSEVPDRIDRHGIAHHPTSGDWAESIGAAFDRRLFLYSIATTPEQDAALLVLLNDDPNDRRYTLRRANCADFAADLLSLVLPTPLRRNVLADFDMATPKNLARQLDAVDSSLDLRVYEIPQIPGTLRRSRPVRGSAESFIKTKRYLFTVLVLQPEFLLADWIAYESKGKWTPGRDAAVIQPADFAGLSTYSLASTSSKIASDPIGFRAK